LADKLKKKKSKGIEEDWLQRKAVRATIEEANTYYLKD